MRNADVLRVNPAKVRRGFPVGELRKAHGHAPIPKFSIDFHLVFVTHRRENKARNSLRLTLKENADRGVSLRLVVINMGSASWSCGRSLLQVRKVAKSDINLYVYTHTHTHTYIYIYIYLGQAKIGST